MSGSKTYSAVSNPYAVIQRADTVLFIDPTDYHIAIKI